MNNKISSDYIWLILAILYLIWPADLMPGLVVDDIIFLAYAVIQLMANKRSISSESDADVIDIQ